jgi:hypothetical protein
MKEIEDKRWRQAASALGLKLLDADGRTVSHKAATRDETMRGALNGCAVSVEYRRGITMVDVRLVRSLALGAKVQVSAPPRAPNGRFAGPGHTVIEGVEPERVNSMLIRTEPGRQLMQTLRSLGSFGWAQLTDLRLRTQSEIFVEAPEGYVSLIRSVVEAALLAQAAREELEPTDWEIALRSHLEAAAGELQLDRSQSGFAITGRVRRLPVEVQLLALLGTSSWRRPDSGGPWPRTRSSSDGRADGPASPRSLAWIDRRPIAPSTPCSMSVRQCARG